MGVAPVRYILLRSGSDELRGRLMALQFPSRSGKLRREPMKNASPSRRYLSSSLPHVPRGPIIPGQR